MCSYKESFEEAELLRNTLLLLVAEEKLRKNQVQITLEVEKVFGDWEKSLLQFIEVTQAVHKLIQLSGLELRSAGIRHLLKSSTSVMENMNNQFLHVNNIIDSMSSRLNVNTEAIAVLKNQECRVARMLTSLSQIESYKNYRKSAKTIHSFKMLLMKIIQKINQVGRTLPELTQTIIHQHSNQIADTGATIASTTDESPSDPGN